MNDLEQKFGLYMIAKDIEIRTLKDALEKNIDYKVRDTKMIFDLKKSCKYWRIVSFTLIIALSLQTFIFYLIAFT